MIINKQAQAANLAMLTFVAEKLEDLCDDVVFLGGCTTALFINDPVSPDVRRTLDVDCIVDVISLNRYNNISKRLREKGFSQSIEDSVICRWRIGDIILDVMPTDEKILGFSNRWYQDAIRESKTVLLESGMNINIVLAPYFLATKLEAFKNRGDNDYLLSHDLEDIISIIDGRREIADEVLASPTNLKEYLSQTFSEILKKPQFHEALPGHLNYGAVTNERVKIVVDKITKMLGLNG